MNSRPPSPRRPTPLGLLVLVGWTLLALLPGWGCGKQGPQPPAAGATADPTAAPKAPPALSLPTDLTTMAQLATTGNNSFLEHEGVAEYRVGPGDLLEIVSWEGIKPLPLETVVRQDGRISFSFLDDLTVAGMTPRQIDTLLSERLGRYVKKVRLDITVKGFQSKHALLFGEINVLPTGKSGPGKYPLRGKTTVLDLIVEAGGVTTDSDLKSVELVRGGQRYTLNLYEAMLKGNMTYNVTLDHNDMVTVPRLPKLAERIYVFGEVGNEGVYPFDTSMNLLTAIGQAGGCSRTAVKSSIQVIRGYGDHRPVVLSADLDLLLKVGDLTQNLPLQNGDVVYVPRTMIGDLNEFIITTTPLLDYLFYPGRLRDTYANPDTLRVLTK